MSEDNKICLDLIHNDEAHGNIVLLEIELGKISDTKLRNGVLAMLLLMEDINVKMPDVAHLFVRGENDEFSVGTSLEYFREKFVDDYDETKSERLSIESLDVITEIITSIKDLDNPLEDESVIGKVRTLDELSYDYLKELLVNIEMYEEVSELEKIRK